MLTTTIRVGGYCATLLLVTALSLGVTVQPAVAQASDTLSPPVDLAAEEDYQRMMTLPGITSLRPGPSGDPDAPDAANTDESRAKQYDSLPDADDWGTLRGWGASREIDYLETDAAAPSWPRFLEWARRFLDADGSDSTWVGTWGTAVQLTEPHNLPPAPGLAGNTLRQVVRVSLGGERLRVRFSNRFGTSPVTLTAVHLASSRSDGAVDPAADRALTFGGEPTVTIPAGEAVTSDAFSFPLDPLSDVAITTHFGAVSDEIITGHPGSRTTSYLVEGDAVSDPTMADAVRTDHWYVITGIDVVDENAAAVVTLGNSITDGRGSGTNEQNRWPDELARRLQADDRTRDVAVLNAGIGGNCVLRACLGPSALDRFERDVLDQPGARWLIVLEGINDIGTSSPDGAPSVAQDLIDAYQTMIDRAHARGIRVFGATLLPFGGSFYDSPEHEAARQSVNAWIRTSGAFDAVVDMDAAMRDPEHPTRLLPAADTGDHLHPNETGHRMIAEAVDLALFAVASR